MYGGGGSGGGGDVQDAKHARACCSATGATPAAKTSSACDSRHADTSGALPATPAAAWSDRESQRALLQIHAPKSLTTRCEHKKSAAWSSNWGESARRPEPASAIGSESALAQSVQYVLAFWHASGAPKKLRANLMGQERGGGAGAATTGEEELPCMGRAGERKIKCTQV